MKIHRYLQYQYGIPKIITKYRPNIGRNDDFLYR